MRFLFQILNIWVDPSQIIFGQPDPWREAGHLCCKFLWVNNHNLNQLGEYILGKETSLERYQINSLITINDDQGIFVWMLQVEQGKSFLINLSLAKVQRQNIIAFLGSHPALCQHRKACNLHLNLMNLDSPICNIDLRMAKNKNSDWLQTSCLGWLYNSS